MILIASPVYKKGSYVLKEYLKRAENMGIPVLLATSEHDFYQELMSDMSILYDAYRPFGTKNQCWNSTAGRNAIRQYVLEHKEINFVLFLDADMIILDYLLNVPIDKLMWKLRRKDVVVSRYPGRLYGDLSGFMGCCLVSRRVLEAVPFRCMEWRNGHVLDEGDLFELDCMRQGFKINRGYFVGLRHYSDADHYREVLPHKMPLIKKLLNCDTVRRVVLELSLLFRCNLPAYIQKALR